eukprot:COSAG02_NODE_7610_length_2935_cov_3.495063_1_plen_96_part_00
MPFTTPKVTITCAAKFKINAVKSPDMPQTCSLSTLKRKTSTTSSNGAMIAPQSVQPAQATKETSRFETQYTSRIAITKVKSSVNQIIKIRLLSPG